MATHKSVVRILSTAPSTEWVEGTSPVALRRLKSGLEEAREKALLGGEAVLLHSMPKASYLQERESICLDGEASESTTCLNPQVQ